MGEVAKIWDSWRNKKYSDVKTYSLMQQSEFVQEVVRKAFVETMVVRLRRVTEGRVFKKVVDLGCATGEWSCKYAQFAGKVEGIDLNESFIERAEKSKILSANPEKISFEVGNIMDFDNYKDADLVCSGAVFMYVNDVQLSELMAKISTNLESGDWAYVRVSVRAFLHKRRDNEIGFYRTRKFYRDLFRSNGFEIVDTVSNVHVVIHEMLREVTKFYKIPFFETLFFKTVAGILILKQILFGGNDFLNFILKKK